jgi:predicted nucleic acid binding AN1-type Zn finger protein
MGKCYHCGTDVEEPFHCPYYNLTFCEEHSTQKAHNCIAQSNQLADVASKPPVAKTIHYVEVDKEPPQVRTPRRKTKMKQDLLGAGVTKRKIILVVLIVAINLFSIILIN